MVQALPLTGVANVPDSARSEGPALRETPREPTVRPLDEGVIEHAPSPNARAAIEKLAPVEDEHRAQEPAADFIIVGGGVGGCTDAGKLISAGYEVLLIERGDDGELPVEALVPAWHPIAS